MRLGKFNKTPTERKKYSIEYSHWLDQGEYLSSLTLEPTDPAEIDLTFVINAIGSNKTKADFFAVGGVAGHTVEVAVTATTTQGQIKQDTIIFAVKDL